MLVGLGFAGCDQSGTGPTNCVLDADCPVDMVCTDGVCQGTPGVVCDDGLDCTDDVCDEAGATCANTVLAGVCLIGWIVQMLLFGLLFSIVGGSA